MLKANQQYVERPEVHTSFLQEAIESWADYKETGLHLTAQEVFAWMATWGTDYEIEMPVCHK
jgi:predicted transcriptional regulator